RHRARHGLSPHALGGRRPDDPPLARAARAAGRSPMPRGHPCAAAQAGLHALERGRLPESAPGRGPALGAVLRPDWPPRARARPLPRDDHRARCGRERVASSRPRLRDRPRMIAARAAVLAMALVLTAAAPASADVTAAGSLRLVSIGSFKSPTYVTSAPGDPGRVFVVEQGGAIRVVRDGTPQPQPFLTVPGVHDAGEQGLLSMAFSPDYATSGRFYVYYNDATACDASSSNCDVRIDEFRRADADHADLGSRRTVLTVNHRKYQNHDGGQLQFGS